MSNDVYVVHCISWWINQFNKDVAHATEIRVMQLHPSLHGEMITYYELIIVFVMNLLTYCVGDRCL